METSDLQNEHRLSPTKLSPEEETPQLELTVRF
jgi:hypothetical protein